MKYYLTYDKKTGSIIGCCKASDIDSLPEPRMPNEGFIEATQKKHIGIIASMNPRKEKITGKVKKEKIDTLAIEPLFKGEIRLSTNAKDNDGDGLPELPADGESIARIKVATVDTKGRVIKDKTVKVEVRVSRGTLSKRQVQTKNGIAEVELRSALETTQCQISSSAPEFVRGYLLMEFIPVTEYEMLTKGKQKR